MSPERWRHIEELYQAARELAPGRRASFLAEACRDDAELRREVEALLAQEDGALAPGTLVGAYRIEATLGQGGMGVVYRALDTKLNRPVAVKFLSNVIDATARHRFQREAQMASSLNHPHILTVHDAGDWEGRQYLVTEFVDGGTLAAWARAEKRTWRQVLEMLVGVADGLAAAHQAGILHRDIKPANILVAKNGYAKLADFGLAKIEERIGPSDPTKTLTENVTRPGMIRGTVPYMSPEQASGRLLDARSDIFSFGVVLYELLAGKRPFTGASDLEVLQTIIHRTAAPLGGELPAGLRIAVEKSLEKDPAERYQSMREMVVDLRRLTRASGESVAAEQHQGSDKHSPQLPLRRRWAWLALLPVLLITGFFVWRVWWASQTAEPLRAVALTTFPGFEYFPSLDPDGNHVVFAWNGPKQDNQDLYVQMIGSGSPLRLTTDPQSDYNPVWSPDGRWIAFFRGPPPAPTGLRRRELRVIPPLGGPERKLADIHGQDFAPAAAFLAWSADSRSLVVTDSPGEGKPDALFVVSLETGEKRPLTNPHPPVLADTSPAVSPDGRSLVFLRRTSWGSGELHLLPLGKGLVADGESKRLTPATLRADFPTWMPDGKEIVFSANKSLWRLAVPGENTPTRIPYVGEDAMMPAISRTQPGKPIRLVYVRSFVDFNFWRIETSAPGAPSSSAPVLAGISSTKPEYHIRFSPDGRRVAFNSGRSGDPEIWVSDPAGSNAVKLTSMGAQETMCPYWSPDGQLILFSSNPEGEFDLYVISAAGGKPRRLTSHPAIDICGSFSPDGKWIYFSSMRSGDYRIWRMPAAGGDAVQVTSTQGGAAVVSPDGNSLYYNPVSIVAPLWRMPISGGQPVKVLDGMVWFNYSLLENGVYYIDRLEGQTRLQYKNFLTGKSTTVAHNLGEVTAGLAASPDGKTILFTRMDSSADDLMLVENFR